MKYGDKCADNCIPGYNLICSNAKIFNECSRLSSLGQCDCEIGYYYETSKINACGLLLVLNKKFSLKLLAFFEQFREVVIKLIVPKIATA